MLSRIKQGVRKLLPERIWVYLRLIRVRLRIWMFRPRLVQHTYGGFPLEIYLSDPVGRAWYDMDWDELPEITLLRRHRLIPGARVFDIGAHQCVVALILAKIVGPSGQVVALEPNRHNADVGQRNQSLNRADQLRVVHAAAAARSGRLAVSQTLNSHVDTGTGDWACEEVLSLSIDDLARDYGVPDVVFVDVEGYECEVLAGARETFRAGPDWFVEVHVGVGLERFGGSAEAVLRFFAEDDYELFVGLKEFTRFRRGMELPRERFFLIALRRRQATATGDSELAQESSADHAVLSNPGS